MARFAKAAPLPVRLTRAQWILISLLAVSVCINYIDRGSLSVGQGYITRELGIEPAQLGLLFSSFFWTYASLQILSGWLVDRFPVRMVYGLGYLAWSLAMLATGLVSSIGSLLILRLCLGAGESVAYPAYSRIISATLREDQRGRANAFIDAGSKLGPAIGVMLGSLLMERLGWRFFFVAMGAASLCWLLPWFRSAPDIRRSQEQVAGATPALIDILQERSAWGTFIGLVCGNYAWYFLVFWLPPYFENERHLTAYERAFLGSAPFWGVAFVSLFGGWIGDRLITMGGSPNRVRKACVCSGLLLATLMLPAMLVPDKLLSLILLTFACASLGLYSSNMWPITQTLAGPRASGKWTGLQNGIGNVSGMIGPWLTGWIVQKTGHYSIAFVTTCCFLVIGAFSFGFIVKRVEPVKWPARESRL